MLKPIDLSLMADSLLLRDAFDDDNRVSNLAQEKFKNLLANMKALGYGGIGILSVNPAALSRYMDSFESKSGMRGGRVVNGIEVFTGALLEPSSSNELSKMLHSSQGYADFVTVRVRDSNLLKKVVKRAGVDAIIDPVFEGGCMNHVVAKLSAMNNIVLLQTAHSLIDVHGVQRANMLAEFRLAINLKRKFDFPFCFCSGASTITELRSPAELEAMGVLFDATSEEVKNSLIYTTRALLNRVKVGMAGVEVIPKDSMTNNKIIRHDQ